MKKKELREKYKQIRKDIENKEKLSEQITNKVLSSPEYINADVICSYISFGEEVGTIQIIKDALKKGKTVGVPITDKTHMDFYKITSIEEIKHKNSFGIIEPEKNKEDLIIPKSIDLIIAPGICFDLEDNRLGFGKGYYDKYLSNKELTAFKIGVCFKEQILVNELIDIDVHDIKMDKVITDD